MSKNDLERAAAAPPSAILTEMQGQTITQGWDVVCAMSAPQINELLAQQYVANVSQQETLQPINATVPIVGDISAQFVNLTLGPPLISFSPTNAPQEATLFVNFVAGTVNTVQVAGGMTTILSSQVITPGDRYALTGTVPLASVEGEVENRHDVVIDIKNGKSFAADLGIGGGGAETTLGQYFLEYLGANSAGFDYSLGTLVYDPSKTNLSPVSFDFATQLDSTDSKDAGRLLLFIATAYNPKGGSQTALQIADIVPAGSSTALIVSSEVLFKEILLPQLNSQFASSGVSFAASQANQNAAYTLGASGSADIGVIEYDPSFSSYMYFSGKAENNISAKKESVKVPLGGLRVSAQDNNVAVTMDNSWKQGWVQGQVAPKVGLVYGGGDVKMTAKINSQNSGSVNPTTDVVSFKGDVSVGVSFDHSSIWEKIFGGGEASDKIGELTAAATQTFLQNLLNFNLPDVNAFAVSNLLFPQQHVLSFDAVYVPGDLIIFGAVETPAVVTSPLMAVLTSSQTQQFTATLARGGGVTWTLSPRLGTISPQGLYTAPARITQAQQVVVTAVSQSDSGNYGSSVVTLVPNAVLVSPLYALMTPDSQPQQFEASVAASEQAVNWSLDGQQGTLAASGLYTPPKNVTAPAAVEVVATSQSNSAVHGRALVVLLPNMPTAVAVAPSYQTVGPGGTQQFTASIEGGGGGSFTWAVVPEIGTVSAGGLYTAPESFTEGQPVAVIATSSISSVLTGVALVVLSSHG